MSTLSKWQQDYNEAIKKDITLPQYQKRFAEWMNNWITENAANPLHRVLHWSDCAVHNAPAMPNGKCDCGAANPLHDVVDVKSAEEILYKHILIDSEKTGAISTGSFDEIKLLPMFKMHVAAMEEYTSQFHSTPIENKSLDALKKAVDLIKQWHNMQSYIARRPEKEINEMWEIYYNNAPEMKSIRESINQPSTPISSNKDDVLPNDLNKPWSVDDGYLPNWGSEPTTLNT